MLLGTSGAVVFALALPIRAILLELSSACVVGLGERNLQNISRTAGELRNG